MEDSGRVLSGDRVFNVVGFAGSLRRGSYNRALLRAAMELAPPTLHIVSHELDAIPLYNADVEAAGAPPTVAQLRDAIRNADGLLIATPEYNHGVPGVLKNTIDWLSRPPNDSALNGKVAAVMGASRGMTGTARGQSQLRQAFVFYQHVRTAAAGGPRLARARKIRCRRSSCGPGDARFPRHLSPALCRI
jgi:chromate reductase, NAD(P)H dehydrogenase (quinone)